MQMPNDSLGVGSNDPFHFKDSMMIMPNGTQFIPVERQEPHARQFCLAYQNQREEFEELLGKVFAKKALIWSLDKNWSKEGDCIVAVFYSNILPKIPPTGSSEITHIGTVKKEVVTKIEEKEDQLFEEFLKTVKHMKSEENLTLD
jgi:hypothetical protein